MGVLKVEPTTKTVSLEEPEEDFLDWLRETLQCQQVESIMLAPGLCLWLDQLGIFKKEQRFWQFEGGTQRLAGVGILSGTTAEGYPCPLPPDLDVEVMKEHIEWLEDVSIVKVDITLQPTATENGLWPRVVTLVTWSDQQIH